MAAIGNDPPHCEVLDLAWGVHGHGPYLVRQAGYLPGSLDLTTQQFVLQKSGVWLINFAFVMLPEAEQEAQLFHSLAEVSEFLDQLCARPVCVDDSLPEGSRVSEILAHFECCTRRILRGMRSCSVLSLTNAWRSRLAQGAHS